MEIVKCPECGSEIAIDERTIYPIDCDCGYAISEQDVGKKPNTIFGLSEQREIALDLLDFPEGSFAHSFLETFLRADSSNLLLLSDDFEVLRTKFAWDKKRELVLGRRKEEGPQVRYKQCSKCGRVDHTADYRFCPLDGTELVAVWK